MVLMARCKPNLRISLLLASITLLISATSYGQLPTTEFTAISPSGAKQGASIEVKITGANLDDLTEIVFSHPGIKGVPKTVEDEVLGGAQPVPNQFTVTVAGNVPTGVYEARLVGHFGASNPRAFAVGNLEELVDDGSNKTLDKAREVAVGSVINGNVDAGSRDYFKVTMKKNERVLIDCLSQRIDSKLDATITVYSTTGGEVLRERGGIDRDPTVDYTAPEDGDYVFAVSDFFYGGGATHFYRMQFHTRPHIDFIFPPAGLPGKNTEYTVYGRNLPGGQLAGDIQLNGQPLQSVKRSVNIPNDWAKNSMPASGEYMYPAAAMVNSVPFQVDGSNVVGLGIARANVIVEKQDNDAPEQAEKVTVPCEFIGQFFPARDSDWVQFDAKAGDVLNIEVISHRLGLDTDPYLIIQRVVKNDKGEEQVSDVAQVDDLGVRNAKIGTDFDTSTDDPSYQLKVAADGSYRIRVSDQFGDGRTDPRSVYRLIIEAAQPDFALVAVPTLGKKANANIVPYTSPTLRAGGTTLLKIDIERRGGFDGEIEIQVTGLPSGVTSSGALIDGKSSSGWLVIEAQDAAQTSVGSVQITGKAKINDKDEIRIARGGAVLWNTANRGQIAPEFRVMRDLMLSVIGDEKEAATVKVGDGNIVEISRGAKIEIPVKITRHGDFKADMKLTATGMPAEIKPGDVTVKGAEGEGKIILQITNNNAKPGVYTFFFVSDAKFKYSRNPQQVPVAEERHKKLEEAFKKFDEAAKKATTDVAAAKKSLGEAPEDGKAAAQEIVTKMEATLKTAQDMTKKVQGMRDAAKKKVDDVKKSSAPKDIQTAIVSSPLRVRIAASPFEIEANTITVKQGAKVELPLKLARKYGFEDPVAIELKLPGGVAGVAGKKFNVDKAANDGTLEITAAENATVGEHQITVRGTAKFNNVSVEASQVVTLKVEAK
jgi:hypothetical protein